LFFPRRDLNPHHWYTAAPFAKPYVQRPRPPLIKINTKPEAKTSMNIYIYILVTLRSSGTDIVYGCHLLLDVCIKYFPNIGDQRPQMLIMDGHDSHNYVDMIEEGRNNSIVLVEIPSHTSHWLQPLDRLE
jgi:hypothetical protein